MCFPSSFDSASSASVVEDSYLFSALSPALGEVHPDAFKKVTCKVSVINEECASVATKLAQANPNNKQRSPEEIGVIFRDFLVPHIISVNPCVVGNKIRIAREEKNLSIQELADLVGVNAQAIDTWELGYCHPRGKKLAKLAEVLEKPVTYFSV